MSVNDEVSVKKICVDLGCGNSPRCPDGYECLGIDMYDSFREPKIFCHLGFEPIPLPDNHVDLVIAYDFLEHLPTVVKYPDRDPTTLKKIWGTHYPRIYLMREVHRILKPEGMFESHTPGFGNRSWAQDPTHCSPPWTDETFNYFCFGYGHGQPDDPMGIDFGFEKVSVVADELGRIDAFLRKPLVNEDGN